MTSLKAHSSGTLVVFKGRDTFSKQRLFKDFIVNSVNFTATRKVTYAESHPMSAFPQ